MISIGFFAFVYADGPDVTVKEEKFRVPFELKIGEIANIDSLLYVSFLNVTEDSRCPSDVTCVWQGSSSIEVDVSTNENDFGTQIIKLGDDGTKSSQLLGDYFIRLTMLKPYPATTHEITPSEYVATLFVGKVHDAVSSPLKQIKNGIEPAAVICKEGLVLVLKYGNDSPACVTPSTADILYQRNWGSVVPPCCKH